MAADPFDVDAAMIAAMKADTALMALCPAGVYYAVAPQGVESFVIVDRLAHVDDRNMYGDAAGETFLYLVKAVIPGSASQVARAAALLIRERLLGGRLELVDYALMAPVDEVESVRIVEVDDTNLDRRVQHAGGHYEVTVQRLTVSKTRGNDHAVPRQSRGSENQRQARSVAQQVDAQRGDRQGRRNGIRGSQ